MPEKPFNNEPIPTTAIPELEDQAFEPIDPKYRNAVLVGRVLGLLAAAIVGSAAAAITGRAWIWWATAAVFILGIAFAVMRLMELRVIGYQLRDHDISSRVGLLTRTTTTVPYSRVTHVEVNAALILNAFGLADLSVKSPGGSVDIRGLAKPTAERLREFIISASDLNPDEPPSTIQGPRS